MISGLLSLLGTALCIVATFDILGSSERTLAEKIVLIILVIAIPFIGPIIYLAFLREKK